MASRHVPSVKTLRKQFDYDDQTGLILFKGEHHNPQPGFMRGSKTAAKEYTHGIDLVPGMPADQPNGKYSRVWINGWHPAHRVAWALYYGEWPNGSIDHINGDGQDNRIGNLRIATQAQNARNKKSVVGSSSKYLGVSRSGNKWSAQIKHSGNVIYLGRFDNEMDAALAYDCAAVSMHREFANPNLIENPYLTSREK